MVSKGTHCFPAERLFPGAWFRSLAVTSPLLSQFLCLPVSVCCLPVCLSLTHTYTGSAGNPLASSGIPLPRSSHATQPRSDQWGFKGLGGDAHCPLTLGCLDPWVTRMPLLSSHCHWGCGGGRRQRGSGSGGGVGRPSLLGLPMEARNSVEFLETVFRNSVEFLETMEQRNSHLWLGN